jgi:hypothetical protein
MVIGIDKIGREGGREGERERLGIHWLLVRERDWAREGGWRRDGR